MNTLKIFKLAEIDLESLAYGTPLRVANQVAVPIMYKYKGNLVPLFLQIPGLLNNLPQQEQETVTLPLLCKTEDMTRHVVTFLKAFDGKIISDLKGILQRSKRYLPSTNGAKKFAYNSIVHNIDDPEGVHGDPSSANGAIKLYLKGDGSHSVKVFNEKRDQLKGFDANDSGGSYISSIVEFSAVVINDNNIAVSCKPHQLRVSPAVVKQYHLNEYSFDESDYEDESPAPCPAPCLAKGLTQTPTPTQDPVQGPVQGPAKAPSQGSAKGPAQEPAKAPAQRPAKGPAQGSAKGPVQGSVKGPVQSPDECSAESNHLPLKTMLKMSVPVKEQGTKAPQKVPPVESARPNKAPGIKLLSLDPDLLKIPNLGEDQDQSETSNGDGEMIDQIENERDSDSDTEMDESEIRDYFLKLRS